MSGPALWWAVASVAPGRDKVANRALRQLGLVTCYLTFDKPVRRRSIAGRRRETVQRPLFPGYLLVRTDTMTNLETLRAVACLEGFLRNHGRLSLLPDLAVQRWQRRCARGLLEASAIRRAVQRYLRGDIVRVEGGLLHDMAGPVQAQRGHRVTVLLGEAALPVELDAETLKLEV